MTFFELSTSQMAVSLVVVVVGSVVAGILIGTRLRAHGTDHQPVAVIQGTLLGLVGLLLAFGLTMAVGRYEARRALIVQEANTIGTTHLRAQLLPEPARTTSLELLQEYADIAIDLADEVPFTDRFDADAAALESLQRDLWAAAGDAVAADPTGTGPRTYVETLNEMIDTHTERIASLRNRVPSAVMLLQVGGSAIALAVLAAYLAILGRSIVTSLLAAAVVVVILFVSIDLDRPQRGFITVPVTPLVEARAATRTAEQHPRAARPSRLGRGHHDLGRWARRRRTPTRPESAAMDAAIRIRPASPSPSIGHRAPL